ncbi:MAG TPA: hypothetical protein DEO59_14565 [Balneola sp.]|nr:hypothetical protein [Balneola sp.]|tara:strand:- start:852 stop:1139 length:288 start_codon:yes stop_codon:yes gene_type:complete
MAFTEPAASINAMLNDFGVSCTSGGTTGKGVLNQPDQVLAGDFIMSTDYVLRAKTSDFGSLIAGASITVDSVAYTVREVRKLNDGTFCELSIQKT